MWILVIALWLGPPKLPPLPGRGMPAPVEPAAEPSSPVDPAGGGDAPDDAAPSPGGADQPSSAPRQARSTAPAAPSANQATSNSGNAAPKPAGGAAKAATVQSRAENLSPPGAASGALATGAWPGVSVIAASGAATGAQPGLRLVGADEVAQWDRQAAAPANTEAPPSKPKRDAVVLRSARQSPSPERLLFRRPPTPPERTAAFVLGYRYFRVQDQLGRAQDWHLASLEVTPVRRYMRVNLLTEFGIESGPSARAGGRADILLMQRLGLGMQYPGFVTPLLEFQGGVGAARVELFDRNDLALVYTLGLDGGVQWAVTRWMFLHAAIGWIRPTFTVGSRSSSFDRVAFKLGLGF